MDSAPGFDDARIDIDMDTVDADEGGVDDEMFDLGGDERRMHVRAYNHWVSLLKGRPYPSIEDLDPGSIVDFGAHSVLLDFTQGIEDPAIAYIGRALREECDLEGSITHIAQVPSRSLLSRLTDHYLQIIANRAPIGFEAEFVGTRGHTTLYRGILMPFSSNGDAIDFIYGVINWKETVDTLTQAGLAAELDAAVRAAPSVPSQAPVWADGPSAGFDARTDDSTIDTSAIDTSAIDGDIDPDDGPSPVSLAGSLDLARASAAAVRAADTRSRATLYRALARAHDFGLVAEADDKGYAALLADAGIAAQPRAPFTPIVKLVFGADYDKTRLAEFAAVLQHARRHDIGSAGLIDFLGTFEGGIKAIVAAERRARKPLAEAPAPAPAPAADRAPIAQLSLATGAPEGQVVVLVARVGAGGTLDILGVSADAPLATRALRTLG